MSKTATADFVVVGAGIAGASAAYALAERGTVVLLEREEQPGYHSTGRSAAIFHETYGKQLVRRLATASRAFLEAPPPGFAEHPLLTPRGVVFVARADQAVRFEEARGLAAVSGVEVLDGARARSLLPVLREGVIDRALYEPGARDVDVHALHHGFLRGLKSRGGELRNDAEVTALRREGASWRIETAAGALSAPIVVDAAGAWADVVAERAGLPPVGLQPLRRTIVVVEPPAGHDIARWPMAIDVDEQFYFKPDAGRLLLSPADETPRPPSDVQPDDYDVALAVDRIQRVTTLTIEHLGRRWAGLRNFVADRHPVVGFDPAADGFFWLAGQGGTGIMTSPAMGRLVAALATHADAPADILALGVDPESFSPRRLRT